MKRRLALYTLAIVSALTIAAQQPQQPVPPPSQTDNLPHSPEINTTLMESTFMIQGPSARPGEESQFRFGTGFVMLRRVMPDSDVGQYVLVTAKHVFEDIKGDEAMVILRKLSPAGYAVADPFPVKIRDHGRLLYKTPDR